MVESRQTCCHNRTVLEKILTFGRDLQNMSVQLRREHGKNETNKKALQVRTALYHLHINPLSLNKKLQFLLADLLTFLTLSVGRILLKD